MHNVHVISLFPQFLFRIKDVQMEVPFHWCLKIIKSIQVKGMLWNRIKPDISHLMTEVYGSSTDDLERHLRMEKK